MIYINKICSKIIYMGAEQFYPFKIPSQVLEKNIILTQLAKLQFIMIVTLVTYTWQF